MFRGNSFTVTESGDTESGDTESGDTESGDTESGVQEFRIPYSLFSVP
ncbi:MAG: hypothetical protein VKK42_23070 [Lyngbya sp.]|nr:hypothetical protein [Lyngbya sp.]